MIAFASREAVAGHVAGTLHVLTLGLWAGGVLGFLVMETDGEETSSLIRRFFPVGLLSILVLGVTGLYQAYVHLPRLSDLWQSPYGQLLLAKTALLGLLVGAGALHQYWIAPRLEQGQGPSPFRRLLGSELAVLALVLGLASVLAAAPLPEAPQGQDEAPLATFEQENRTQDFVVRVLFDADTLGTAEEYRLDVELRPRTSIRTDEVEVNATLHAPTESDRERSLELEDAGQGRWRTPSGSRRTERGDCSFTSLRSRARRRPASTCPCTRAARASFQPRRLERWRTTRPRSRSRRRRSRKRRGLQPAPPDGPQILPPPSPR